MSFPSSEPPTAPVGDRPTGLLGGALILFDGKMTGFRDAGGSPSMFFNPGDCIGLEHLGDWNFSQMSFFVCLVDSGLLVVF